jgi:hypothetical protein
MVKFNAKLIVKFQIADLRFNVLTSLKIDIVTFWVMVQCCSLEGSSNVSEEQCLHLHG